MIYFTNHKAILSGDILELYCYEHPIGYGFEVKPKTGSALSIEKTEKEKGDIQKRSLSRTRSVVRRNINSNARQWRDEFDIAYEPKFITLTFAKNVADLSIANIHYSNFIKRLNYEMRTHQQAPIKYTAVAEFQKRGAVHYHFVVYNAHWIPHQTLQRVWGHGFIKIRPIENIGNVGLYMTKYLTKDALDRRLRGRKRHFSSRGLRKFITIRKQIDVLRLSQYLSPLASTFQTEYESEYQGKTMLQIFDLSTVPHLKTKILNYLSN